MAMTALIELNDFFLEEWSGILAVLVIRVAWLMPKRSETVQPSVFCFGLTGDWVSLLTAAVDSLDVILLIKSSIATTVVHEYPD